MAPACIGRERKYRSRRPPEFQQQDFSVTERPARKLAVLLHADVAGSTALVHRNETIAHARVRDTFQRCEQSLKGFDQPVRAFVRSFAEFQPFRDADVLDRHVEGLRKAGLPE